MFIYDKCHIRETSTPTTRKIEGIIKARGLHGAFKWGDTTPCEKL